MAEIATKEAVQLNSIDDLAFYCGLDQNSWNKIKCLALENNSSPIDYAISTGIITEKKFCYTLASLLGISFTSIPPKPIESTIAEEAFMLRYYFSRCDQERLTKVIAPNGETAEKLLQYLVDRQHLVDRKDILVIITTQQALLTQLINCNAKRINKKATHSLPQSFSARKQYNSNFIKTKIQTIVICAAFYLLLFLLSPIIAFILPSLLLAPIFIISSIYIIASAFYSMVSSFPLSIINNANLPKFTILVPLFKEADILADLIKRLSILNYPREKLELFFLIEEDDEITKNALSKIELPSFMLVFIVPKGMPRTKPRALNAALPFATGELLVVYDAEDAPEKDQLLLAASTFSTLPRSFACIQARLAIANAWDSLLTCRFAIEYASLFDCTKAGASKVNWIIPLGGSSNYFRTAILRQVGGWDAWNVTEDADLGIRLARFGWLVGDLPSTTWEEAPIYFSSWFNQRTRWMKGWFQTLFVHMRDVKLYFNQLGFLRGGIFAATAFSVLLSALLFPFFTLACVIRLLDPTPLREGGLLLNISDNIFIFGVLIGFFVELIPSIIALKKRKAWGLIPFIILAPVSYFLVSCATWRALFEFFHNPFHWHKTQHGISNKYEELGGMRDFFRILKWKTLWNKNKK